MSADYERQLAEWKLKHGFKDLSDAADADEVERVADREVAGEDYCVCCGDGPFSIRDMVLITERDDPYIQPEVAEDSSPLERVRACPKCWKANYGEDADND